MFNFREKSRNKATEEFEFLEINLIINLPLDYAYLMKGRNIIIQKANREELV